MLASHSSLGGPNLILKVHFINVLLRLLAVAPRLS